ncbi:hypothetical protein PNIG_a0012 [Pseudoalteromonas nigrifaciens]|uniref:Uncharacterized protein n=1 Tax=Pseudoalteromonas nigrifaciens TaxID=28109 RepID=A0AAC9UB12_9GAMM|nr:hypothetical protein PNIG_a0012 [Pseudoalteromonas nigrifaciens]SUC50532.1 Uncharacterised protein [Pseudoalteromonas nigrifaciens]
MQFAFFIGLFLVILYGYIEKLEYCDRVYYLLLPRSID